MNDLEKNALDILITEIPEYPPLKPGGDVTISEMYPNLTKKELEYIKQNYKGQMSI